jgi:hypothetical protein
LLHTTRTHAAFALLQTDLQLTPLGATDTMITKTIVFALFFAAAAHRGGAILRGGHDSFARVDESLATLRKDPFFDPEQSEQVMLSEAEYQAAKKESLLAYHDFSAWKSQNDEKTQALVDQPATTLVEARATHLFFSFGKKNVESIAQNLYDISCGQPLGQLGDRDARLKALQGNQQSLEVAQRHLKQIPGEIESCAAALRKHFKTRTEQCRCAQFECENDPVQLNSRGFENGMTDDGTTPLNCDKVLQAQVLGLQKQVEEYHQKNDDWGCGKIERKRTHLEYQNCEYTSVAQRLRVWARGRHAGRGWGREETSWGVRHLRPSLSAQTTKRVPRWPHH